MPKIINTVDLTTIKTTEEFMRHGSRAIGETADAVNGNLEFDKNLKTQTIIVTFPTANTDVAIAHNFNKVSVHYMPVKKSATCDIVSGTKNSTPNTLYLQSTAPATVTLVLF